MLRPSVSCIVPVFNGERYLGEALDSIFAQNYEPLEVLVVNDGSTDGTAGVLAKYSKRLICLEQKNKGPAACRNFGVKASRGEFVAFLDQDDLWHCEKLSRQIARFEARPELELSIAHARMFWVSELHGEALRLRDQARVNAVPGYTTGALVARRTSFDGVGYFDSSLWFGDATDWFLRAADRGTVMELLPDVLLYHRIHTTNLTRRRLSASRDEFLRIVKCSLDNRRQAGRNFEFPLSSGRGSN
jgi:glycosyltransferase involved in cell wall biosynthesis